MTTPTTTAAPRLPIPNGWQMTLLLSIAGQPGAIVLGGLGNGTFQANPAPEIWRDRAWANLRGAMSNQVTCTAAIVRDVSVAGGRVFELGAPTSGAGDLVGATPLLAACTLVKWRTGLGGRSGKGRTFLPGIPASAITSDGRTVQASHATTTNTYTAGYLNDTALNNAGLDPAVLSFRKGVATVITGASVGTVVGIQRRRMR